MLLAFAIAGTTASCDLFTATARGIGVRLDATPLVAQTGDTVTFTVNVTAQKVSGISIDFGDASGDQFATGGVSAASVTFKHAYDTTGTYMARAAVSDAV